MKCPRCQGEMEPGHLVLQMPFFSLNFGLSSKDLHFKGSNGSDQRLLRPRERAEAGRCKDCGCVVMLSGALEP